MFIFACFSFHACYGIIARFFAHVHFGSKNLFKQHDLLVWCDFIPGIYTLFVMSCFTTMRRIRVYRYTGIYGIPVYRPILRSRSCFPSHIPPIFQQHHQSPVTLYLSTMFFHPSLSLIKTFVYPFLKYNQNGLY